MVCTAWRGDRKTGDWLQRPRYAGSACHAFGSRFLAFPRGVVIPPSLMELAVSGALKVKRGRSMDPCWYPVAALPGPEGMLQNLY
jgi:hypothetical protein